MFFLISDILEELTALESTITMMQTTSNTSQSNEEASIEHKGVDSDGCVSLLNSQSPEPSQGTTNGLSTPSRLRSLRIVSERLASFRRSLKEP